MNSKMPSPGRQVSEMARVVRSGAVGREWLRVAPSRRPPPGLPGHSAGASPARSAGGFSGDVAPALRPGRGLRQVDGMAPRLARVQSGDRRIAIV